MYLEYFSDWANCSVNIKSRLTIIVNVCLNVFISRQILFRSLICLRHFQKKPNGHLSVLASPLR